MKCGLSSYDVFREECFVLLSDLISGVTYQDIESMSIYERDVLIEMLQDKAKRQKEREEKAQNKMKGKL